MTFISVDEERPFPRSLSELVEWLWHSTVTSEVTVFRRSGMRCFSSLCPLLSTAAGKAVNPREAIATFIRSTACKGEAGSDPIRNLKGHLEKMAGSDGSLVASVPVATSGDADSVRKQQRWLESLNTSIDAYNWVVKLRYVTPAELFLDSGGAASSSAATSKKRKEAGSSREEVGGGALFDCIGCCLAHFEQLLLSKGLSAEDGGAAKTLRQVRLETLYRIMLLVNSVLAVCTTDSTSSATAEQFGEYFRQRGVWARGLQSLIMSALLGEEGSQSGGEAVFPSLLDRHGSAASHESLSAAVRTLFGFVYVLEPGGSQQFNGVVAAATKSLFAKLETFTVNRHELSSFAYLYLVIRDCSLEHAIFGYHYKARIRAVSVRTLLSVCEAIGASTDPAVVEVGRQALQLVLDMGFPLVHDDVAEERSMVLGEAELDAGDKSIVGLLSTADKGTLLLDKYREVFAQALLATAGESSLVAKPHNFGALLAECVKSTNASSSSNLFKLLHAVLHSVAAAAQAASLPEDFVSGTLLVACEPQLQRLPHSVLTLLLEIDSFSPPRSRSRGLLDFCVKDAVSVLESAKAAPEDICARLVWLPFLVSGTAQSAPRPVSLFGEDKTLVDKVSAAAAQYFRLFNIHYLPDHWRAGRAGGQQVPAGHAGSQPCLAGRCSSVRSLSAHLLTCVQGKLTPRF